MSASLTLRRSFTEGLGRHCCCKKTQSHEKQSDRLINFKVVSDAMVNSKVLCCLVCVGIIGVAFLTAGVVMYCIMPTMVDSSIKSELVLSRESVMYEEWSKLDIPMETEFYVFHVVNPNAILNGSKPIVEERGPYVYRHELFREKIAFSNNGTVSYDFLQSYYFDESKSVGSETDKFTSLNIPLVAVNHGMRYMGSLTRMFAETVLQLGGEPLFIELSIRDFIWGYRDNFISRMSLILPTVGHEFPDHFGTMYQMNGTKIGSFEVDTGKDDNTKLGNILTWNGKSTLEHWQTEQCKMINGSDGTVFPSLLDSGRTLYFYNPFYCRSFPLVYQDKVKIKDLDTFRFVLPSSAFDSPDKNPANEGFCTPLGNCPPSGMVNISHCNLGSPVLLSQPHFRDADPSLLKSLEGLKPEGSKHQTVMELEAKTGVILQGTQRMQINIYVDKKQFRGEKKFDKFYLPVMWLAVNIYSQKLADVIDENLYHPEKITSGFTYAAIAVGAFFLLCAIVFGLLQLTWKQRKNDLYGLDNAGITLEYQDQSKKGNVDKY